MFLKNKIYVPINAFLFDEFTQETLLPISLGEIIVANFLLGIKYLINEFKISILYNIVIGMFFFLVLRQNFESFWSCHYQQTLWMYILSILNMFSILPKVLMVTRISKILRARKKKVENMTKRIGKYKNSNELMIIDKIKKLKEKIKFKIKSIFKCRVYYFNTQISKLIFFTNCAGFLNKFLSNNNLSTCFDKINDESSPAYQSSLTTWCNILFIIFLLRMLLAFVRYYLVYRKYIIGNEGVYESELKMIPSYSVTKDIQAKKHADETLCSICYLPFMEGEIIRVLSCEGNHEYHKNCIDVWLTKKNRCPLCNKVYLMDDEKDF